MRVNFNNGAFAFWKSTVGLLLTVHGDNTYSPSLATISENGELLLLFEGSICVKIFVVHREVLLIVCWQLELFQHK